MSKPQNKCFDWGYFSLWKSNYDEKCKINIPDTVLNNNIIKQIFIKNFSFNRWIFTSKSGDVVKRKDISVKSIKEKFNKLSNTESVCMIRRVDGVSIINKNTFSTFIDNWNVSLNGVTALQSYVGGNENDSQIYYNEYYIVNDLGKIVTNTIKTNTFELIEDPTIVFF